MTKPLFSLIALALTLAVNAQGATYTLKSSLAGQTFLDAFLWEDIPDPTHGDVTYVNSTAAKAEGLYSITNSSVILRADNTTVLNGNGPGRNSFRLKSLNQYTTHVSIFDIVHMPEGCGTWPAVWFVFLLSIIIAANSRPCRVFGYRTVGADWPNQGEIDIVEGVNNQPPNTATLHTSGNCSMPANRTMTGENLGTNCDAYATGNTGCGVGFVDDKSYGPPFNTNGGGWYAIERSATYIAIYFWERGNSTVPCEVSSPGGTVDTSDWGVPVAYFPSTDCDFTQHFGAHNIIINLAFCGDWAGNSYVYAASGCPSTCSDYVNANPSAFTNAYFEFNSLTIYE